MKNPFRKKPKVIKRISFKFEKDSVQIFDCKTKKDIKKAVKIGVEWVLKMYASKIWYDEHKKRIIPSYDVTFKEKKE